MNCVPQGNILVLDNENGPTATDSEDGGEICFDFQRPLEVFFLELMDIPVGRGDTVQYTVLNEDPVVLPVDGLGPNSVQSISIDRFDVVQICVTLLGEGAITNLVFCEPEETSVPSTTPTGRPSVRGNSNPLPSAAPSVSPAPTLTGEPSATPSDVLIGSISGTVFEDTDGDGVGNSGIPGVTLTLLNNAGQTLATTVTDENGNYSFLGLPIGQYTIIQTNLPNYIDVSDTDGANDNRITVNLNSNLIDAVNNNFVDERVTLSPTASSAPSGTPTTSPAPTLTASPTASPSDVIIGSISGTVFEDTNNDDVGDEGLPSVTLTLLNGLGEEIATTTTDANGDYSFPNLPLGTYTVVQTNLPNYIDVSDTMGANDNRIMVILTPQGVRDSVENNFVDELVSAAPSVSQAPSISPTVSPAPTNTASPTTSPSTSVVGSISGTVLEDRDNDDIGDVGIPGVTVTVFNEAGEEVATTVTDENGNFSFPNLPMGTYTIVQTNLPDYVDVSDTDGANDNRITVTLGAAGVIDSTGNVFVDELLSSSPSVQPQPTSTPTASPVDTITERPTPSPTDPGTILGSISGTVLEDIDNNDTGDVPLVGVRIDLFDSTGTLVATTFTDGNGFYQFVDLPLGDYTVVEVNLPNYLDVSDVDGANDNRIGVSLSVAGIVNSTGNDFVDELISAPPSTSSAPSGVPTGSPAPTNTGAPTPSPSDNVFGSITGTVFEDLNNDDVGDVGIPGVTITLLNEALEEIASTVTDENGNYSFTGLPPGRYTIVQTNLPNYLDVGDTDGANDNRITVMLSPSDVLDSTGNNFVDERLIPITSAPTDGVTGAPSPAVTVAPTDPGTAAPSPAVTDAPTDPGTAAPSPAVTGAPTDGVSAAPSDAPSDFQGSPIAATAVPSGAPSAAISSSPSLPPTDGTPVPTEGPQGTASPSAGPSVGAAPTAVPIATSAPSDGPGFPSISAIPSSAPTSGPTDVCVDTIIDFQTDGDNTGLVRGDYVGDDWFEPYGLTVTAVPNSGGFAPNGNARIFDSANPGSDPDLGSPNSNCGGPGVGAGGRRGQRGQNCNPIGNVLIIQSEDKEEPDDNPTGGNITFAFDTPVQKFLSLGLLDIENNDAFIEIVTDDASGPIVIDVEGEGNNAVQTVSLELFNVRRVTVSFPTEGAITFLNFCAVGDIPTAAPVETQPPQNEECSSLDFPCAVYPNKLQICYYSDHDDIWMDLCIKEEAFNDIRLVFPVYCGPCVFPPQDPNNFRSKTFGNTTEVDLTGLGGENCPAGDFGVDNVEIIESDGNTVDFRLTHSFCPSLDRAQVWFTNPGHECPSLCYEYSDLNCNTPIQEYNAKCEDGWARLHIIAQKDDEFSQDVTVATPRCQDDFNFQEFNGNTRCYWSIKIPCICDRRRRELQQEVEDAMVLMASSAGSSVLDGDNDDFDGAVTVIESTSPMAKEQQPRLRVLSQDGDTTKFAIQQACDVTQSEPVWAAVDYLKEDDTLDCKRIDNFSYGEVKTFTARCDDGATVVDVYTGPGSRGGSAVALPEACGLDSNINAAGWHERYLVRCRPTKVAKAMTKSKNKTPKLRSA